MNDPIAVASAWTQLQSAWVWRWFFIVSIGAIVQLWCWATKRNIRLQPWAELHRYCSLGALVLTLWSIGLFVDTWQLDAQDPRALSETVCKVTHVPTNRFERLACSDGAKHWLDTAPEKPVAPGQDVVVTTLPVTGLVVRVRPANG